MSGKSWLFLHEYIENHKKERIQSQIVGHIAQCILDEFSFVNFPTLKECLCPPVITKEEKQNNLLYKRMKEIDDEIWKNRVKKDNDMMYHKEQPEVKEEPVRNRKARRKLAKEIKQKKNKGVRI